MRMPTGWGPVLGVLLAYVWLALYGCGGGAGVLPGGPSRNELGGDVEVLLYGVL